MTALISQGRQAFPVRESGPQGLRRPRFSFFRFTCQTARNLAAPSPAESPAGETKTHPPDAATRTWPCLNGRMLGHRVNSEGLRRCAIAPSGGAPKRTYIGFGELYCQPFDTRKKPCGSAEIGNFCPPAAWPHESLPRSSRARRQPPKPVGATVPRRTAATFLGRSWPHRSGRRNRG